MKIPAIVIVSILISVPALTMARSVAVDTINLIGVLYKSNGSPASNVIVRSQQTYNRDTRAGSITVTDENGQFALYGISTDDTLTVESLGYTKLHYYNKGSRLMVIFLPPEKINDLNSENPIEITAKRITPKIPAQDIVLPKNLFTYVESMPEFPGGSQQFLKYIHQNLKYPDKAIKNNIEGTVEVAFTVGKDGQLNNFNILKGLGYDCENYVIKLLVRSPAWKPGIMNGVASTSNISVSVKFSLTDK